MPARAHYEAYTVKKGDTLAAIAKRYGVSIAEIAVTSGIADVNKIKVGQSLSIPLSTGYDPLELDLAEVQVNARRIPSPASEDPVVAAVNQFKRAFEPPNLYMTLALIGVGVYYLISDERKHNRRR